VLLKVTFYGMSDGFAGKEILKEEGGKRLTPSSTCCDRVNVDGEF
jgi:hypothetical protein